MRKRVFILFLAIVGCNSTARQQSVVSNDGLVMEMGTVNLGAAPGVIRLATPRISAIAEEVSKMREMDVLCFEELWTQEYKDAVIKALGPEMHVFYVDTRGENQRDGVNVCSPSQAEKAISCARDKCGDWPAEEQTICVVEQCSDKLFKILLKGGFECLHCLVASVGMSVDGIVNACVQPNDQTPIAGMSRAFGGQNGGLLASRRPLMNVEALRLRASFSNRVALFATIDVEGYESIELVCAHISTTTPLLPNHPDFSTWDEEMIAQIEDVSKRLKQRAGNRPSVFLGDMNAGPAIGKEIAEEAPMVWKRIVELGFSSSAIEVASPAFCTMCKDNTLSGKSSSSTIIDHILVRDPSGGTQLEPVSAYPFFDKIRKFAGYDGEQVEKHLSDHCGVVVNFRLRKN